MGWRLRPEALAERGISAGRFPEKEIVAGAEDFLHQALKVPDTVRFIAAYLNQSFYFSPTAYDGASPSSGQPFEGVSS
jgi:hypothetical protein